MDASVASTLAAKIRAS